MSSTQINWPTIIPKRKHSKPNTHAHIHSSDAKHYTEKIITRHVISTSDSMAKLRCICRVKIEHHFCSINEILNGISMMPNALRSMSTMCIFAYGSKSVVICTVHSIFGFALALQRIQMHANIYEMCVHQFFFGVVRIQ